MSAANSPPSVDPHWMRSLPPVHALITTVENGDIDVIVSKTLFHPGTGLFLAIFLNRRSG
jgi:hypothetical protein